MHLSIACLLCINATEPDVRLLSYVSRTLLVRVQPSVVALLPEVAQSKLLWGGRHQATQGGNKAKAHHPISRAERWQNRQTKMGTNWTIKPKIPNCGIRPYLEIIRNIGDYRYCCHSEIFGHVCVPISPCTYLHRQMALHEGKPVCRCTHFCIKPAVSFWKVLSHVGQNSCLKKKIKRDRSAIGRSGRHDRRPISWGRNKLCSGLMHSTKPDKNRAYDAQATGWALTGGWYVPQP